ncbi:DUF1513 domain-containing protein [Pseudomonas asuensis]|uniref:DUF1513 domain-containing protein n=1 Tax=Pseudomonas asuensis TaxID=1825787 RepID=A0ABQ2GPJ6_9PSED|nr:DUF1513 domain-containing protein [Pseudomonas asuensis]GGM04931.1 hypothetical protein GCM10009425_15320 [Pseudomonas asuensis]
MSTVLSSLLHTLQRLGSWTFASGDQEPLLLSARDDVDGHHYAVGYRLNGKSVFVTQVAQRCHAIVTHPEEPFAVFVARRPGTQSYVIDLRDGKLVQTLDSPSDRHFYGHGVFHASGEWFYATENDTTDPGRGLLSAYRFNEGRLTRTHELSTHGLGPHEVAWMPDGETFVVANGGIRTEAESRVEMNLHAMEPSLVLMSRSGELLSKETLDLQMNSIRHLAIATDGTILACQQYMGAATDAAAMLGIKRPGKTFEAFPVAEPQRQAMAHYTASVAVHSELRLVALTAPRGNRFFIWDVDSGELRLDAPLPDCAGVGAVEDGFIVTSGQGRCRHYDCSNVNITMKPLELPSGLWDNHLLLH